MKKRFFALILTAGIIGGSNSAAISAADKGSFMIDGNEVTYTVTENNSLMVPLRAAAEALGYKVEWIAESKTVSLEKDKVFVYITFTDNGYSLTKTAPFSTLENEGEDIVAYVKAAAEDKGYKVQWNENNRTFTLTDGVEVIDLVLGKEGYTASKNVVSSAYNEAVIKEGTTLVAVNMLSEALNLPVSFDGSDANVITAAEVKGTGTVKELITVERDASQGGRITSDILFEDNERGEVLLHIDNKNTVIKSADDKAVNISDIVQGSKLEIVYGDAMTASLPPQNVPKSITILEDNKAEELTITGKVIEKTEDYLVVESDEKNPAYDKVALVITENTKGKGTGTKANVGDRVNAAYSPVMTRSIPPQAEAFSIELLADEAEELTITGKVIEKTEEYLVVESDEKNPAYDKVALVITQNTKGTGIKANVGDRVNAAYSPVMTRSIPPQAEAFSIELIK